MPFCPLCFLSTGGWSGGFTRVALGEEHTGGALFSCQEPQDVQVPVFHDVSCHCKDYPDPFTQPDLGKGDIVSSCISWDTFTKTIFPSSSFWLQLVQEGQVKHLILSLYLPVFKTLSVS